VEPGLLEVVVAGEGVGQAPSLIRATSVKVAAEAEESVVGRDDFGVWVRSQQDKKLREETTTRRIAQGVGDFGQDPRGGEEAAAPHGGRGDGSLVELVVLEDQGEIEKW
jgi:hypothetical protein